MKLEALQHLFWNTMRTSGAVKSAPDAFTGDARMTTLERVHVYQRSYWYRLANVLFELYPRTVRVLGRADATRASRAFLEAAPSDTWLLEKSNARWPAFLAELDWLGVHAPRVAGLAALERARLDVWMAAEVPAVDMAAVNTALLPLSTISLGPQARLLTVGAGAAALWADTDEDAPLQHDGTWDAGGEQGAAGQKGAPPQGEVHILAWRDQAISSVSHVTLDAPETAFLRALQRGAHVHVALDAFQADGPQAAAAAFGRLVQRGLIASVTPPEGAH